MKKKSYTIDNLFKAIGEENGIESVTNMMEKDGALVKRHGWKVVASFVDEDLYPLRINGIFEFDTRGKSCLIVHAGEYLFECDYDFKTRKKLTVGQGVKVEDRRTQGYMYQDLLWICGMGELAIYDGERVFGIYEHPLPLVPTTSVSIHDDWLSIPPTKNQGENRLTLKRKNSFIGSKGGYSDQSFFLDGQAKYGEPFTIEAKFRVKRRSDYAGSTTTHYEAKDEDGRALNTVAVARVHIDSLTNEKYFLTEGVKDIYERPIQIVNQDVTRWYFQLLDGKELYLSFSCPAFEEGVDNIYVEYTLDSKEDETLKSSDHFAIANTDSGNSIMILCTGKNELIYTDKDLGFSFFPKENIISIGSSSSKIRGILPMANNYVGIFKDEEFYRVLIDGEKSTVLSTCEFCGASNPFLVKRLENDCITVNQKGIFGLCHGSEGKEEGATFYKRDSQIQKELLSHSQTELRGATSAVVGGSYFLFIGDRAYVTNVKSKCYKRGKSGDEFEYKWYIFESCPCYSASVVRDILYMGREDGNIAIFDDGYTDRGIGFVLQGDMDALWQFEQDSTRLFFNERIKLEDKVRSSFDSHYLFLSPCTYENGTIEIPYENLFKNGEINIFEGDYLLVNDAQGHKILEGRVLKTNPSLCTALIDWNFFDSGQGFVYVKKDSGEEYTLEKNEDYYIVKHRGENALIFQPYTHNVYIKEEKNIDCVIKTSPLDLGSWERKNLYEIDLTPSPFSKGRIRVGYETEKNVFKKEVKLGSALDFDSLDLDLFSFNSAFKSNVQVRCLERGFDYIVLTLQGYDTLDFGIEKIGLKYTQLK